jgi:hypothetical protein
VCAMWTSLLLTMLTVAPGHLAVPSFSGPLPAETLTQLAEQLGQSLSAKHYTVVAPASAAQVLSAEQQAGLAACRPQTPSCFGSFATALGCQGVALGAVEKDGQALNFEVRIVSVPEGTVVATARGHADSLSVAPAALEEVAKALVVQFEVTPEAAPKAEGSFNAKLWTPVIAGLVVLGAGIFVFTSALVSLDATRAAAGKTLTDAEVSFQIDQGIRQRNLGIVGMSLGAASILFGVIFGRDPSPTKVSMGWWLDGTSGGLVLHGRF